MFESHDQGRIEYRPQPLGFFVERCRPARIIIDDLDPIHFLGSITPSAWAASSGKRCSCPGNVRGVLNEIQQAGDWLLAGIRATKKSGCDAAGFSVESCWLMSAGRLVATGDADL